MNSVDSKKEAIYNTTLTLISEYGFQGTPMSRISKKAGVSVGIIYHYFENKTDLLNSLYLKISMDYQQYVLNNLPESQSVEEILRAMFTRVMDYYITHMESFSFIQQYDNSPYISADTHKEKMNILGPVVSLFEKGIREKVVKDLPPDMLIALSFGAVVSLAKYNLSQNGLNKETLEEGMNTIWDIIKR